MSKYLNRSVAGILLVLIVALFVTTAIADQVAVGTKGMVASDHIISSQVGAEILAAGGNAVDAAVATAFTIGLAAPYCAGIGGEGMMVIALADGTEVAIDFRSWAPGSVDKGTSVNRSGPNAV
ncbi:gamma-glutamyltransferase, partial [Candidatus Bipolaricaulota bacterium]|nr:gamma-glutamyltransferase [Candidatus Bipolaricaulota bacterium]